MRRLWLPAIPRWRSVLSAVLKFPSLPIYGSAFSLPSSASFWVSWKLSCWTHFRMGVGRSLCYLLLVLPDCLARRQFPERGTCRKIESDLIVALVERCERGVNSQGNQFGKAPAGRQNGSNGEPCFLLLNGSICGEWSTKGLDYFRNVSRRKMSPIVGEEIVSSRPVAVAATFVKCA